jgi:hypothetical protein
LKAGTREMTVFGPMLGRLGRHSSPIDILVMWQFY